MFIGNSLSEDARTFLAKAAYQYGCVDPNQIKLGGLYQGGRSVGYFANCARVERGAPEAEYDYDYYINTNSRRKNQIDAPENGYLDATKNFCEYYEWNGVEWERLKDASNLGEKTIEYAVHREDWDLILVEGYNIDYADGTQKNGYNGTATSHDPRKPAGSTFVIRESFQNNLEYLCDYLHELSPGVDIGFYLPTVHTQDNDLWLDGDMFGSMMRTAQFVTENLDCVSFVLPGCVTYENVKTTYLNDLVYEDPTNKDVVLPGLFRDSIHASYYLGRETEAMGIVEFVLDHLYGDELDVRADFKPNLKFESPVFGDLPVEYMDVVRAAVDAAIANPWQITTLTEFADLDPAVKAYHAARIAAEAGNSPDACVRAARSVLNDREWADIVVNCEEKQGFFSLSFTFGYTTSDIVTNKSLIPLTLNAPESFSVGEQIDITLGPNEDATAEIRWYRVDGDDVVEIVSARNQRQYTPTTDEYDLKIVANGTGRYLDYSVEKLVVANVELPSITFEYSSTNASSILKWDEFGEAETYNLLMSKDDGATWTVVAQGLDEEETTVGKLYPGVNYRFRIEAFDSEGRKSRHVLERRFTPFTLDANQNVYLERKKINLQLDPNLDLENDVEIRWYYVLPDNHNASESDETLVEIVDAAGSLNYAPNASVYPIRVIATGLADSLGCNASVDLQPLSTLNDVEISYDSTSYNAIVSWETTHSDAVASWRLYVAKDGKNEWTNVGNAFAGNYKTVQALFPEHEYTIRIVGLDAFGQTVELHERQFLPFEMRTYSRQYGSGKPVVVMFDAANDPDVDINWYLLTPEGEIEVDDAAGKRVYTFDDVEYDLKIVATGLDAADGCVKEMILSPSTSQDAEIVFDYHHDLMAATLSWEPIEGAATYSILVSKNGGASWTVNASGLVDTSRDVGKLYPNGSYLFRVVGTTADGARIPAVTEGRLMPFTMNVSKTNYAAGDSIEVEIEGSDDVEYVVQWFFLINGEEVEIDDSFGKTELNFDVAQDDVKIVATGIGDSAGIRIETILAAIPEQRKTSQETDGEARARSTSSTRSDSTSTSSAPRQSLINPIDVDPSEPTITISYDAARNYATLSWSPIEGSNAYRVRISRDYGATWVIVSSKIADTTRGIATVVPGNHYGFQVFGMTSEGKIVPGTSYKEFFAPFVATLDNDTFRLGDSIEVDVTASQLAEYDVIWSYVTENGDVEIEEARGRLQYQPTSEEYDVRIRVEGFGVSQGIKSELYVWHIQKPETPSMVVDSTDDVVDPRDGKITLREAATIYATDKGTITFAPEIAGETITLTQGAITLNQTLTIDANPLKFDANPAITIDAQNASRIFEIAPNANVSIKGLALSHGNVETDGGAIYVQANASLKIEDSKLTSNQAGSFGGAIFAEFATVGIYRSEIDNNQAYSGGAINVGCNTKLTISNSSLHDNSAEIYGGALRASNATTTIDGSDFSNNVAKYNGGAIRAASGILTVTNSVFSQNEADSGGAIDTSSKASLNNVTLFSNKATQAGGAIYATGNSLTRTFQNIEVYDNVAKHGAGVYASGIRSSLTIRNGLFYDNVAEMNASAIETFFTTLNLYSSTIALNTSEKGFGAVFVTGSAARFGNSIIAENNGGDVTPSYSFLHTSRYTANNVLTTFNEWTTEPSNYIEYDPSEPLFIDVENRLFALAEGSQAIDQGDNAFVASTKDISGAPRVVDDNVDLGAYEYGAPIAPTKIDSLYDADNNTLTLNWLEGTSLDAYQLRYKTTAANGETNEESFIFDEDVHSYSLVVDPALKYDFTLVALADESVSKNKATLIFAPLEISLNRQSFTLGDRIEALPNVPDAGACYQWSQLVDDEWIPIEGANSSSIVVDDTLVGKTLRVVATGTGISAGTSSYATVAPTLPISPEALKVSYDAKSGQLTLIWDDVADETGYRLTFAETTVNIEQNVTSYSFVPENGLHYYFTLVPTNESGVSESYVSAEFATPSVKIDATSCSVGQTLDAALDMQGIDASFQWEQLIDGEWEVIVGATEHTLTITNELAGRSIRVEAIAHGVAEGVRSYTSLLPEKPTAPETLVARYDDTTNTLTLTWDDVDDETGYLLTFGETTIPLDQNTTSYSFAPETKTRYDFALVSYNDSGSSQERADASFVLTNVSIDAESFTLGQTLSASLDEDVDDALFQWSQLVDGEWITIDGATTSELVISQDLTGRSLRVEACATNIGGGFVSYATVKPMRPVAPTSFSAHGTAEGNVLLTWDDAADETSYRLWFNDLYVVLEKDVTSVEIKTEPGKVYSFALAASNEVGTSKNIAITTYAGPEVVLNSNLFEVGDVLTATLSATATATCQWSQLIDGEWIPIEGATNSSLTITYELAGRSVRVEAVGFGFSEGAIAYAVAAPKLPQSPASASVKYDSSTSYATIQWDAVSGATGYVVRVGEDSFVIPDATNSASIPVAVNNLLEFFVYATNESGESLEATKTSVVPTIIELNATEFKQGDTLYASILNGECESYQWSVYKAGEWVEIDGAVENSFTLGKEYAGRRVKVAAVGSGHSEGSTSEAFADYSPTIEIRHNPSTRQATLSWDTMPNAESYNVKISRDGGKTWITYAKPTETNCLVNNLVPSVSYAFRVLAVNEAGKVLYDQGALEEPFTPILAKPGVVSLHAGVEAVVDYLASDDADVEIQWYTSTSEGYVEILEARGSLRYVPIDDSLPIKAVLVGLGKAAGQRVEVLFETPDDKLSVDYDAATAVGALQWTKALNAKGYEIEISRDRGANWEVYATTMANSYNVERLYGGTEYLFRVYPTNGEGLRLNNGSYYEGSFTPLQATSSTKNYRLNDTIRIEAFAAAEDVEIRWYIVDENGTAIEQTALRGTYCHTPTNDADDWRVVVEGRKKYSGQEVTIDILAPRTRLVDYSAETASGRLTWTPVESAVGYVVKISRDGGQTWGTYKKPTDSECEVFRLAPGKEHSFRIYAVDANGKSALLKDYANSFAPIGASCETTTYHQGDTISIACAVADASYVDFRWYKSTPEGLVEIQEARGLDAYAPTDSDYALKAVLTGKGAATGYSFTFDFEPASETEIVFDSDATTRSALLTWNPLDGAVSYNVKISRDGGQSWITYKKPTEASCVANNLHDGYRFRVYAVNAAGKIVTSNYLGALFNFDSNPDPTPESELSDAVIIQRAFAQMDDYFIELD